MKASEVLGFLRVRSVDPACTGTTGAAAGYVGGLACLREWRVRAMVASWESLPPVRSVA